MKRCFLLFLFLLGMGAAQAQQALTRNFPAHALRGTFQVVQWPEVLIDGQPTRLSPGSKIYNQMNMIVLPTHVGGGQYVVNYTREIYGMVHLVWILTDAEAAVPRSTASGTTTLVIIK